MSSTTLVTFLVQTPQGVNTLGLLGSWDNFSKPYPMKKDSNAGSGHWRGCHSFTNIVCDGETVETADSARDGALKMGGRYWYYYKIDDDLEFHDPREPSTRNCPFLPGQEVNILEVPIQVNTGMQFLREEPERLVSATQFTLDPEDKYRAPVPPSAQSDIRPKSRHLQNREASLWTDKRAQIEFEGKSKDNVRPALVRSPTSPSPMAMADASASCHTTPPTSASSIKSTTSKLRRWRSVISRVPSSKSMKTGFASQDIPPLPRPKTSCFAEKDQESNDFTLDEQLGRLNLETSESAAVETCLHSLPAPSRPAPPPPYFESAPTRPPPPPPSVPLQNEDVTRPLNQDKEQRSWLLLEEEALGAVNVQNTWSDHNIDSNEYILSGQPLQTSSKPVLESDLIESGNTDPYSLGKDNQEHELPYSNSIASSRTSGAFSSVVDTATVYTEERSSWRLSQPLTPTMSDFGGLSFEKTPASPEQTGTKAGASHFQLSGFHGYSLPEAEHASALTIRNLETATSQSSHDDQGSPFQEKHRQEIIDAWNAGAEQPQSSMKDLVDDLGYLGSLIA